jgi:hypothetical protein
VSQNLSNSFSIHGMGFEPVACIHGFIQFNIVQEKSNFDISKCSTIGKARSRPTNKDRRITDNKLITKRK